MRGHVRQRPSGKWAIWFTEGVDENGRRKQRSIGGFATRREAQAELTRKLAALQRGEYVPPERLTFGEFCRERWLPIIGSRMRTSTLEAYERTLRLHVFPAIGGVQLQKLDASRLDRLYVDLLGRKELSPNTVRFVAAVISSALDYATRTGLVTRNVAKLSSPPRWQKRQPRTWTSREVGAFLEHVSGEQDYALWAFLALSGARRGEALGLSWLGLDLDAGTALITQQVVPTRDGLKLTPPKTATSSRLIALDARTVEILRAHRAAQVELRGLYAEEYHDHDLVFCRPDGSMLDPRAISNRFRTLSRRAGLPEIRLHDLRHAVGMAMFREGMHPEAARRRLGHSTIATTIGVYTSAAAPEVDRRAAEALADAIFGTDDELEEVK